MTLEQLGRLRAMCNPLQGEAPKASWDLNRDDMNAIYAAIRGMPNPRLVEALEAVLLFYSAGPWGSTQRAEWDNLTDHADCTTRGLCDFIRERLAEPFGPDVRSVVKDAAR